LVAFGGTRFHGNLSRQALRIKRNALTADESAKTLNFQFALSLRNYAELQARVSAGEVISQAELAQKYYPTEADYGRVRGWLAAHGARHVQEDGTRMTVFAQAPVQVVASVLQVPFAVVTGDDNAEYVAAVDDPVLPDDLQALVVAVNGLQPQVKVRPLGITVPSPTWNGEDCLGPRALLQLYNGDKTGLNGAGQTIVVLGSQVDTTDLVKFWSDTGVPQTLSNFTVVNPGGSSWTQTDPTKNASNDDSTLETTLDCEWAAGVAAGAKVELYQTTDWAAVSRQIAAEVQAGNKSIHQVTCSFGSPESDLSQNALKAYAQYFVTIAANGITIFAASGDNGSNETNSKGATVQTVDWPASDVSVTGVGGTSTDLAGYNNVASLTEHAWSSSGGGVSSIARPSWQTGTGVPGGAQRCVPDVAAPAWGNFFPGYFVANGQVKGIGGTSLSSPIWGGICALLNQSRMSSGLSALGVLGPKIYPLQGTGAFNDIADGASNGAYTATAGYDLVTGLGSPNIAQLASALSAPSSSSSSGTTSTPTPSGTTSTGSTSLPTSSATTQLSNISSRTFVGTGADVQIAGFIISGSETKKVLIRSSGPALADYSVTGYLTQPQLKVYSGQTVIATNNGWDKPSTFNGTVDNNSAANVTATTAALGATPFKAGSADCAIVMTLAPGGYTAMVNGANGGTGIALIEVFDANPTQAGAHLSNISTRSVVKTGANVQIAGFIVGGSGVKSVLIRANGPALKSSGLTNILPNPTLTLYSGQTVLMSNTAWGGTAQLTAAMKAVNATAWPSDSQDSAILTSLQPGAYTALVKDANGAQGDALIEVYELP